MRTPGFSRADLTNLMNEAAILAGRRGKELLAGNARETVEHFALFCDHTTQILALPGIDLAGITELSDIFDIARDRCVAQKKKAWDLVITASLWSIWLSRNRKVFDDLDAPIQVTAQQCLETCKLWSHRARKDEKTALSLWFLDWAA
jgi:hypothetical protein